MERFIVSSRSDRRLRPTTLLRLSLVFIALSSLSIPTLGGCPQDAPKDDFYRLGRTQYFLFQREKRHALRVDYEGAKTLCSTKGLRLAQIPNIQTDVLVSRELEKWMKGHPHWVNSYYWIDGAFSQEVENYVWGNDTSLPVQYHNFYYNQTRPKGLGDFVTKKGKFIAQPKKRQSNCLSVGMPGRTLDDSVKKPKKMGLSTSWWERLCTNVNDTSVLCESINPRCKQTQPDSVYPETSGDYFQGLWPLSNRRFVVSWTPQTAAEAKATCQKYKLELYSPHPGDECLVETLKQWAKGMTVFSFWTDKKYDLKRNKYLPNNNTFAVSKSQTLTGDGVTCASMFWNYEIPPFNYNRCNCVWKTLTLSPENCNDRIGFICQHPDHAKRNCTIEYAKKVLPNLDRRQLVNPKHISEFYDYDGKTEYKRSAFKQLGLYASCPVGYRMANKEDLYWGIEGDEFSSSQFLYDYNAAYWLQPEGSNCVVSRALLNTETWKVKRYLTNYKCSTDWAFVLCRKIPGKATTTTTIPTTTTPIPEVRTTTLYPTKCDDPAISSKCSAHSSCKNVADTEYGFDCVCGEGYQGNGLDECTDINECAAERNVCGTDTLCHNLPGFYSCSCVYGYRLKGNDSQDCVDINECEEDAHICKAPLNCVNTRGSYKCECPPGYLSDGAEGCADVNECSKPEACGLSSICVNLMGNYECACPTGFQGDPFETCTDIDECAVGIGGDNKTVSCGINAKCMNSPGSYDCDCIPGYTGDPMKLCQDIDECRTGMSNCTANSVCKNTPGSFECTCKHGYLQTDNLCADVDECDVNYKGGNMSGAVCGIQSDCINTPGSFVCNCLSGYSGNPLEECTDIDECKSAQNVCGDNAGCSNTPGSYECQCNAGFHGNAKVGCQDTDECREAMHNGTRICGLNAVCVNNPGSFDCRCAQGYQGDPTDHCDDIDECHNGNYSCGVDANCVNLPGSYKCVCAKGFIGDARAVCNNINECSLSLYPCAPDYTTCTDTIGSFICACKQGYSGDPRDKCTPVDECQVHPCGRNAVCVNTVTGYRCSCPPGMEGRPDPKVACEPIPPPPPRQARRDHYRTATE